MLVTNGIRYVMFGIRQVMFGIRYVTFGSRQVSVGRSGSVFTYIPTGYPHDFPQAYRREKTEAAVAAASVGSAYSMSGGRFPA